MRIIAEKPFTTARRISSVLVLAGMLALLALLSVPTGHAAAHSRVAGDPTIADLEQYTLDLINASRAEAGLAPYTWNGTLADVARTHSQLNLDAGGCANVHQCPGEPEPCTRMNNAGVSFIECRENVGYWQAYPTLDYKQGLLNIHQFFMNEGPCGGCHNHYENIMSSNLQEVGVGVAIDDNHVWVTEDFIQPDASAPLVTSITASVSPGSYDCSQDHTKFNFSATVHLSSNPNGVTLTYVWLRSDGGTMSPITITVPAGQTSASISTYWFLFTEADNGTYWEQVAVSAPNSVTSNQATFSKAC